MYLCLRVDLDYVPWDTPDAREFGHGEPAVLLRLLELGRSTGYKFHFFISNRSLRAFPANADAALNDGHDLDWLCKHPEAAAERYEEAIRLFKGIGHRPVGMGAKAAWPSRETRFPGIEELQFLSAPEGPTPDGLRLFPVEVRSAREASRAGLSARAWTDSAKNQMRQAASLNRGVTLVVRPQVLAKYDPKLSHVREILDLGVAIGLPTRTLRDEIAPLA